MNAAKDAIICQVLKDEYDRALRCYLPFRTDSSILDQLHGTTPGHVDAVAAPDDNTQGVKAEIAKRAAQ